MKIQYKLTWDEHNKIKIIDVYLHTTPAITPGLAAAIEERDFIKDLFENFEPNWRINIV